MSDRPILVKLASIIKGLFHPGCIARAVSWVAIVIAIFVAHENGDNKSQLKNYKCNALSFPGLLLH